MRAKKLNQQGLVSIVVTMLLILVMTLVVLGMSRNSIREQRQALDRQLRDQAYYNAESGINDWVRYIYSNNSLPLSKSDCATPTSDWPTPPTSQLDDTNSYTCVLYDKAPYTIIYGNLDPGSAETVQLTSTTGIDELNISWSSTGINNSRVSGCSNTVEGIRPASLSPDCNVGGVRIDMVDTNLNNMDQLRNNLFSTYLLPNSNSTPTNVAYGNGTEGQGRVGIGGCIPNAGCNVRITNLGLGPFQTRILHLRSLYLTNNVTISGTVGANPVRFVNAQYMLDVTGKSVDVLKRLQVRVPATPQYDVSAYPLRTADSICKLIDVTVAPVNAAVSQDCTLQN